MILAENGNNVKVHYKGTLQDGTVFDSSRERNQTMDFQLGGGQLLPDFENAVVGMSVGQTKSFNIPKAYGEVNPEAIFKVPRTSFPENFEFQVGQRVGGSTENGQPITAVIRAVEDDGVVMDHNHPLAGEDLNFEVELMEIE